MLIERLTWLKDFLKQQRGLQWVLLTVVLILWARPIWAIYSETGLFWWLGTDFALYHTQSKALWSTDPSAIYNQEKLLHIHLQLLSLYAHDYMGEFSAHVPYPPIYAWLFTPFTIPSPPVGFLLWESLNLLAALNLAWRATQFFNKPERLSVALMLLASYPHVTSLLVGQPQVLLACAVAESFLSLRAGQDFRAGLWIACLLIKPQYGILLGALLIWKRRWHAVAGAILGGGVILVGSVLVAGIPACLAYPNAFTEMVGFRSYDAFHMINWRSFVLWIWPHIPNTVGLSVVLGLGIMTVVLTALAWRGAWEPSDRRFPAQVTVLLLATLLANYHSFSYGAIILAVPLAAVMGKGHPSFVTSLAVIVGVILPSLAYSLGGHIDGDDSTRAALILKLSLVTCFFALLIDLLRPDRAGGTDTSMPSMTTVDSVTGHTAVVPELRQPRAG